jgi:hypothetical protein
MIEVAIGCLRLLGYYRDGDARAQTTEHASCWLVQNDMHDPADRAFPAPSWGFATRKPGGTERVAMHDDWQSAKFPLQLCMQVVVVEVSGVESPVKGTVTFGGELCANAASHTPKCIAAAAISIERARMMLPASLRHVSQTL